MSIIPQYNGLMNNNSNPFPFAPNKIPAPRKKKKMKRAGHNWEKMFALYVSDKELLSGIHREFL